MDALSSPERAKNISSKLTNPDMSSISTFALQKCGNCAWRIKCGNEVLPLRRIIQVIVGADFVVSKKTTVASRAAVQFLRGGCFGPACLNDTMPRCIKLLVDWLNLTPNMDLPADAAKSLTGKLQMYAQLNDDELAKVIQGIMNELGLTTSIIVYKALKQFLWCKTHDAFTTPINSPIEIRDMRSQEEKDDEHLIDVLEKVNL